MDLTDPSGHCIAGFGSLCSLGDKVVSTAKKVVSAVKKVVSSAVDDSASYSVREVEALRASAARVTRDVTTKVKDVVKPVVHVVVRAVVQTEKRVVTRVVSTAKSVAKHVTSAAKTVAKTVTRAARAVAKGVTKAAKVVAKGVTTAVKAVARASVSVAKTVARASTSVASAAWSHRRGLMQIGMVAAAVGLTVLNVAQLGLDPATDAAEAVDIGALASEGAEEGASIAAEAGTEGAEEGASEAAESSADEVGDDEPGEGDDDTCPAEGGESFTAGTRVVLASGATIAISQLKVGDKVLASDTRTGKDQPETVTAVLVHRDTDLYNLKVKTSHGTEVIHTTSKHLFWAPSLKKWLPAAKLRKGEALRGSSGNTAIADGGTALVNRNGWMWDLTVPGNDDHDFYVTAGTSAVLVHNINSEPCAAGDDGADDEPSFFRGARSGEEPSFAPRPNEYKVDPETGTVRPTHGVSLFDNPESLSSKGFTPYEVDQSSIPDQLRIIQRGANPSHYEIVPQQGTSLTPEDFAGLLCQIVCTMGE